MQEEIRMRSKKMGSMGKQRENELDYARLKIDEALKAVKQAMLVMYEDSAELKEMLEIQGLLECLQVHL